MEDLIIYDINEDEMTELEKETAYEECLFYDELDEEGGEW